MVGRTSAVRDVRRTAGDGLACDGVPGTVQSIERAAAILQVVASSGGALGVTDIAAAVETLSVKGGLHALDRRRVKTGTGY